MRRRGRDQPVDLQNLGGTALDEIKSKKGKLYDPDVVDACEVVLERKTQISKEIIGEWPT